MQHSDTGRLGNPDMLLQGYIRVNMLNNLELFSSTAPPTQAPPPPDVCAANMFRCNSGQCIPLSDACNRRYDCADGSDEQNCRK